MKHEEHAGQRAKEEEVNIGEGLEEEDDERVLFSDLIGRQRLSNEEITSCLTKGNQIGHNSFYINAKFSPCGK